MKEQANIGRAEMEILQYVAAKHPVTVREVADHVGETKGLVRTTVLNVMERLRTKGFLKRKKVDGVYRYAPTVSRAELMRGLVRDFVRKSLGGSVSPFVAYLADEGKLTAEEVAQLRKVVREMEKEERA